MLVAVALLPLWPTALAQAVIQGTYQFTASTGVANTFDMATGATAINFTSLDDGVQTVDPFEIGFPFLLDGTSYSRFSVNTNGLLKLGNDSVKVSNTLANAFSHRTHPPTPIFPSLRVSGTISTWMVGVAGGLRTSCSALRQTACWWSSGTPSTSPA